jgi:hypothetical protein
MTRWLLVLVALCWFDTALAQEVRSRPYDGIQAGLDAFDLAEEQRQANLQAQIQANDAARAAAGLPTTRGETIYYYGGYSPYGVVPWDSAYSYGYTRTGPFGRSVMIAGGPLFSPWPYVPGDVYGYRTYPAVRQPIGQRQEQTGPNRWESHPVYDPPVPQRRPLPPVDSEHLRGTQFDNLRSVLVDPAPAVVLPQEVRPKEVLPREEELPPPPPLPLKTNTARDF